MMLGDHHRQNPITAIQVPPWPVYDEPTSPYSPLSVSGGFSAGPDSPQLSPYLLGEAALPRFLPSNDEESDSTLMDAYCCDEFRMYEFKVRWCARGRSHDWTECSYAHPGEKARRRDPRKYHYSGTPCPDFRKGSCKRGDSCEFAHGVFECWLHPARYRTQPCKNGINCRRRVCFFAHTHEQLRVLPQQHQSPSACDSYDVSPMRRQHHNTCLEGYLPKAFVMSSSPTSTLVSPPLSSPLGSPPLSPSAPPAVRREGSGCCGSPSSSVSEVLASLRKMQISKAKSSGSSAGAGAGAGGAWGGLYGVGLMDGWDEPMERVESGRDLRVKMVEWLSKENPPEGFPDVGWVSDLLN